MKLSIAYHGKKEPIAHYKNDKVFEPKVENAVWKPPKKVMTVNTTLVKISTLGKAIQTEAFRDQEMRRRTLKEVKEKTYPFPDSDVVAMLKDLLDKKVIDLPECKRPEEMNRADSPRYCKFHHFISHPTEKCFVLKDLIMKLAQKGIIELDLDDVVKSNYTTITSISFDSKSSLVNRLEAQHDVKVKPSSLPTKRTEEGFDPNTYKLMSNARYDFASSSNLGKKVVNVVNDKEHNLTKTQKKLKEHGY